MRVARFAICRAVVVVTCFLAIAAPAGCGGRTVRPVEFAESGWPDYTGFVGEVVQVELAGNREFEAVLTEVNPVARTLGLADAAILAIGVVVGYFLVSVFSLNGGFD